jgi:hypothetical protein
MKSVKTLFESSGTRVMHMMQGTHSSLWLIPVIAKTMVPVEQATLWAKDGVVSLSSQVCKYFSTFLLSICIGIHSIIIAAPCNIILMPVMLQMTLKSRSIHLSLNEASSHPQNHRARLVSKSNILQVLPA